MVTGDREMESTKMPAVEGTSSPKGNPVEKEEPVAEDNETKVVVEDTGRHEPEVRFERERGGGERECYLQQLRVHDSQESGGRGDVKNEGKPSEDNETKAVAEEAEEEVVAQEVSEKVTEDPKHEVTVGTVNREGFVSANRVSCFSPNPWPLTITVLPQDSSSNSRNMHPMQQLQQPPAAAAGSNTRQHQLPPTTSLAFELGLCAGGPDGTRDECLAVGTAAAGPDGTRDGCLQWALSQAVIKEHTNKKLFYDFMDVVMSDRSRIVVCTSLSHVMLWPASANSFVRA
jgi:hypothetical protein